MYCRAPLEGPLSSRPNDAPQKQGRRTFEHEEPEHTAKRAKPLAPVRTGIHDVSVRILAAMGTTEAVVFVIQIPRQGFKGFDRSIRC